MGDTRLALDNSECLVSPIPGSAYISFQDETLPTYKLGPATLIKRSTSTDVVFNYLVKCHPVSAVYRSNCVTLRKTEEWTAG